MLSGAVQSGGLFLQLFQKETQALDNCISSVGLETMCPGRGSRDSLQLDTFRAASSF